MYQNDNDNHLGLKYDRQNKRLIMAKYNEKDELMWFVPTYHKAKNAYVIHSYKDMHYVWTTKNMNRNTFEGNIIFEKYERGNDNQ